MLLGVLAVAVALARVLVGGRLAPRLPLVTWPVVLALGVVGQLVLARWDPAGPGAVAIAVTSHAALLSAGIVNFRLPGVAALTAGQASNAVVMLANRGMPVSGPAVAALGGDPAGLPSSGHHHLLTDASRLPGLADVVGIAWLDLVVSAGDALLVVGAIVLLSASLAGEADDGAGLV